MAVKLQFGYQMGITEKSSKGEISTENYRGRIRLRWRYNGIRYTLNLPYDHIPDNIHYATVKTTEIRLDIMKGCFDTTLEKYKDTPSKVPATTTIVTGEPSSVQVINQPVNVCSHINDLLPLFNYWVTNIRSIDLENTSYYFNAKKLLEDWRTLTIDDVPEKLNSLKVAPTTYNDRLTCLRGFFAWLLKKSKIICNPLDEVSRRKKRKKINDKRRPLSEAEILLFLQAIKEDTYCPKCSRYKHSYYYPFFHFIFLTGVRNAEAIGLRVKHVNFTLGNIEISETFARTRKGSNHAARIRKGTKMENVRYLPLDDTLRTLLASLISDKQPDDFVFPSPTGLSIDDQTLQRRVYKPVMKSLGFGNKDLYVARHSYGTRSIEQGISATSTAYAMGHATAETTIRNYVNVVKPATQLPQIKE